MIVFRAKYAIFCCFYVQFVSRSSGVLCTGKMALHLLYVNNTCALQRERVFRDRTSPLDSYSDKRMHKYYRFTRNGMMHIIDKLEPHLRPQTLRSHAIDATTQIFIALRFYAIGCFYSTSAAHHSISEASVCRVVHRVTDVLVAPKDDHIKWPTSQDDITRNQWDFFALYGFPGAIGAVDCTHVPFDCCPFGENEHVYVNRKGIHSINVQLICDTRYKITNVVPRWPGSTHDSRILETSQISRMYERGDLEGVLLGDGGYPKKKLVDDTFQSSHHSWSVSLQ